MCQINLILICICSSALLTGKNKNSLITSFIPQSIYLILMEFVWLIYTDSCQANEIDFMSGASS